MAQAAERAFEEVETRERVSARRVRRAMPPPISAPVRANVARLPEKPPAPPIAAPAPQALHALHPVETAPQPAAARLEPVTAVRIESPPR